VHRRLVSALNFFPRGGSSHVARALARELPAHGWDTTLVAGSRTDLGPAADARRFFAGIDVRPVSFDVALRSPDPLHPPPPAAPLHPSYEDRPGAPDRVLAALDDRAAARQAVAWTRALRAARAAQADVLHLHHLTPLHEAARPAAPEVPVVGHLHGTELLFLEAVAAGPPPGWTHAAAWAERMRGWAQACARLVLLVEGQRERAERLLGIDPERCTVVPNGVDPVRFARRPVERAALWRRVLVDAPRGWRPGGGPGSVRYAPEELAPLVRGPVVVSVGRFTAVKRTALLVEAFACARARLPGPAALVLVGGHPGEWEDEHPADAAARLGVPGVFLAGWYEQDELPELLSGADVLALASVREQFGQVLVEGMACGLPPVAVDALGPAEVVEDGRTGWLVPPDDAGALADALVAALGDPAERARRAAAARETALERYAWPALAGPLAAVLDEVAAGALTT